MGIKGHKNILASIWHSRYENNSTDVLNPQAFADEYISTEEDLVDWEFQIRHFVIGWL